MLSLRLFRKQFSNYFNLTIRHFGAKKDGYGSSGISDKEVDKTKKTIPQGGLKSDGEKKAKVASSGGVGGAQNPQGGNTVNPSTGGPVNPKSDDKVETQTSNVSLEKVKVIETVSNHKVLFV